MDLASRVNKLFAAVFSRGERIVSRPCAICTAQLGVDAVEALHAFGSRLRSSVPGPRVEELRLGPYRAAATWVRQQDATWLVLTFETEGSRLEDDVIRIAFTALAEVLGVQGGEPQVFASSTTNATAQFLLESLKVSADVGRRIAA